MQVIEGAVYACSMPYLIIVSGSVALANLLSSVFWWMMVFMEVPTGLIADRLGPKRSTALSLMMRAFGFALIIMASDNLTILALGLALAGTAATISTGTVVAYIKSLPRSYPVAEGVMNAGTLASELTAARTSGFIIGTVLALTTLLYLGIFRIYGVALIVIAVTLLTTILTWHSPTRNAGARSSGSLQSALKLLRREPRLLTFYGLDAIFIAAYVCSLENWFVVYVPGLASTPIQLVGGALLLWTLRYVGARVWRRLESKAPFGLRTALCCYSALIALAGLTSGWLSGTFFAASVLISVVAGSMFSAVALEIYPPNIAATLASIQSVLENALVATLLFCFFFALSRSHDPVVPQILRLWVLLGFLLSSITIAAWPLTKVRLADK